MVIEATWDYGGLWRAMGIYRALWGIMGTFGNVWGSMGTFGHPFWARNTKTFAQSTASIVFFGGGGGTLWVSSVEPPDTVVH